MDNVGSGRNYWAFVARPDQYRVEDVVRERAEGTWLVEGHPGVRAGDRALVWKARGRTGRRGVVALAEITEDARLRPAANPEYYTDPAHEHTPRERVAIRYRVPSGLPLWHDENPETALGRLSCARAHGGTVFHVTPDQWEAVLWLAGGWPDTA